MVKGKSFVLMILPFTLLFPLLCPLGQIGVPTLVLFRARVPTMARGVVGVGKVNPTGSRPRFSGAIHLRTLALTNPPMPYA